MIAFARFFLHLELRRLERRINRHRFDAGLSRKIDAITIAIETLA